MKDEQKAERDVQSNMDQDEWPTKEERTVRRQQRASIRRRRLWVSLIVIAAAVILRFAAPQTVDSVRERAVQAVCGSVDFKAAAQVLGQGLSGEMALGQAFEEAYTYAFNPTWGDVVAAGGNGG